MLLKWVNIIYPIGGAGVTYPTLYIRVVPSLSLSGHVCETRCFLVISFLLLCRIRTPGPIYMSGWTEQRFL